MMSSKQNPKQPNQTNEGLLSEIWDALRKYESIRSLGLSGLSIKVELGEVYLDGYLRKEHQPLVESTIHSVLGVVEVHNCLQTDDSLLANIWDVVWKEDAIRSMDSGSLSVKVMDGEVYLSGHLAQETNLLRIERIAKSVAGVVAVHKDLVTDRELILQVSQALARDRRTRPYILPVNASHGWIHVGGEVPTCALQQVVETVAVGISGVRGVIALPRVTGESPDMPQLAVQPHVGAIVYGWNREEGVVTQVVVQPEDRLVSHIIVRSNAIKDTHLLTPETVVPVKAIDLAKDKSVLLGRNGPSLSKYPLLDPDEFPLAPFTWKAPYPYTAGEVRWSLREILEPDSHPAPQLEMKPWSKVQDTPDRAMAHAGI